jgi:plastocyanin
MAIPRRLQVCLLLALVIVVSGTVRAQSARADLTATQIITIADLAFQPSDVTIQTGGNVTWVNGESDTAHTSTAADGSWDSGVLSPGDTYAVTFSTAGDYAYACSVHPDMHGVVHVVDAS